MLECKHVVLDIVSQREMDEWINNSDVKTSGIIRSRSNLTPSFLPGRTERNKSEMLERGQR